VHEERHLPSQQETNSAMTQNEPVQDNDDRLLFEAAEWLVRLASGDVTESDAAELVRWRAQSPDHDDAFRKVASIHTLTRAVATTPAPVIDRRAVLAGGSVLGAAVAAFGIMQPPLSLWPSLAELMADHRTGAGERYAFSPMAGVDIELNSRTSVSLVDSGRGIALISGEAFVDASSARQPFSVEAGSRQIIADAAILNVQALGGVLRITCARGRVQCRRDGHRDDIHAGEQLAFDTDNRTTRTRIDPAKAAAWRRGLLIFEGVPLGEVIEQINLYRAGRIILTDAALGRRSVNGVFHTDRIDSAVEQIQQALGLRSRHLPGGVLLMG